MRLLLIEDEHKLADALEYILKKNNYVVDVAYDGILGQDMAETGIYDVIILDRVLPGKEGVEILRALRSQGVHSPVIFLTAKDTVKNRIEGLDAGADDYLVKPFATEELLARIRALGRRVENELVGDQLHIDALSLNPLQCEILSGEVVVKLTLKETQLLELLMRNAGQVMPKERIFERIWGYDCNADLSAVELYIYYLRKKLDTLPCGISIETVRGVGYCLKEVQDVRQA